MKALSALLVLAIGATACGSTVQVRSGSQVPGSADGLSAPVDGGGAATPDGATATGGTGGTVTPGGSGTGTLSSSGGQVPGSVGQGSTSGSLATAGTGSQQPASTGSSAAAAGFGFTSTTANIGVEYSSDANGLAKSAGFSSLATGDDKGLIETMVKDINSKGGVLGRKINPIFQDTSATADPTVAAQATCSAFSQDSRVFAALIISQSQSCLTKKHIPSASLGGGTIIDDIELKATAPYFRRADAFSTTHLDKLLVDRLVAKGFLTTTSKVGILWPDAGAPSGKRTKDDLKRLLAARGINVVADYGFDDSTNTTPPSSVPNAVLPFRSANVDRVVGVDANVAYFMIAAEQQGYRPRYALTSTMNLASVMETIPPAAQLAGSMGVGWQGPNDVDLARLDVKPPGFDTCVKYIDASNQKGATGAKLFILLSYCNALRLYLFAAQAGGGFDNASVIRGFAEKGSQFPSAIVPQSAFSSTRMDAAGGARDIAYDTSCSCFRYASKTVFAG